jgi:ankyrin repeat protein
LGSDERTYRGSQTSVVKGALVNGKAGPDGDTPLHYAAMEERLEMIEYLAKNGADINAKNNNGLTPYQRALDAEQVKELLKRLGANE